MTFFTPDMRGRLRAATLLLLVATIALVPPLVRATARFGADQSTPLRLNRGFESPPSKCTIAPPLDLHGQVVPTLVVSIHVEWFDAPGNEPLPNPAPSHSPDPLRGPPLRSRS
ncbi:MAG TPA: hypothetical protein VH417_03935 [Vicinamibacterales bacterium]